MYPERTLNTRVYRFKQFAPLVLFAVLKDAIKEINL